MYKTNFPVILRYNWHIPLYLKDNFKKILSTYLSFSVLFVPHCRSEFCLVSLPFSHENFLLAFLTAGNEFSLTFVFLNMSLFHYHFPRIFLLDRILDWHFLYFSIFKILLQCLLAPVSNEKWVVIVIFPPL